MSFIFQLTSEFTDWQFFALWALYFESENIIIIEIIKKCGKLVDYVKSKN
jgi:hypothetical protein